MVLPAGINRRNRALVEHMLAVRKHAFKDMRSKGKTFYMSHKESLVKVLANIKNVDPGEIATTMDEWGFTNHGHIKTTLNKDYAYHMGWTEETLQQVKEAFK